jgi:hypothetical protein
MSLRNRIGLFSRINCSCALIGAALMTSAGCFGQTTAPAAPFPSSNAEIAWFWTGRVGINPTNGNVTAYGYLSILNGVPGLLFGGTPAETNAFFSFRISVFQAFYLPPDLDQLPFLTTPATIDIYYDPKPNRNWNDPNTFSTGQKVATYARPGFQGTQAYVTQYQAYSAKLVSSTPFTVNGTAVDFSKSAPGVTVGDYVGVIPGIGFSPDFPLAYSISSYAVAIGLVSPAATTSAVAGPPNATVVTSEFRLDGSKSTSALGSGLKYSWTLAPGSPTATLLNADSATPTVRFGETRGVYTFQLRVTDEEGNSSADFTAVHFVGK